MFIKIIQTFSLNICKLYLFVNLFFNSLEKRSLNASTTQALKKVFSLFTTFICIQIQLKFILHWRLL